MFFLSVLLSFSLSFLSSFPPLSLPLSQLSPGSPFSLLFSSSCSSLHLIQLTVRFKCSFQCKAFSSARQSGNQEIKRHTAHSKKKKKTVGVLCGLQTLYLQPTLINMQVYQGDRKFNALKLQSNKQAGPVG